MQNGRGSMVHVTTKDGRMHLIMELYHGSLAGQLQDVTVRRFDVARMVHVATEICRITVQIHEQGILLQGERMQVETRLVDARMQPFEHS